jgi:hypothetical protein
MTKIYRNKALYAAILAGVLALSAVTQFGTPQAFAQVSANSNSILRLILSVVQNIQAVVTNPDYGLKEIKREVKIIEDVTGKTKEELERLGQVITNEEYGLKEIKREVRNIEDVTGKTKEELERLGGIITNERYGLKEIKREVRNIELGHNLQKEIIMKELDFPVDVERLQIITIPKEQEGFLEEISCVVKDAGAWAFGGAVRVVVNVNDRNGNSMAICAVGAEKPSSNFVDDFVIPDPSNVEVLVPRLRLHGGETVDISCHSSDLENQGCSVEVDLWLKVRNKPLPTPLEPIDVLEEVP